MKKLFLLVCMLITLFVLGSCDKVDEYDDLELNELSFVSSIKSSQMSVRKNINLSTKVYSRVVYNDLDIEIDSLKVDLEDEFITSFRANIAKTNLFKLKGDDLISNDEFGAWIMHAEFVDLKEPLSYNYINLVPKQARQIDEAIYNLTGDTFFNSLPSTIFNPPLLGVTLTSKVGDYLYELKSSIEAINYKWNKEEILDNDIIEEFNNKELKAFEHKPYLELKFTNVLGYSNRCISFVISQYNFEEEKFSEILKGENIYGARMLCSEDTLFKVNVTFDAGTVEYAFYINK